MLNDEEKSLARIVKGGLRSIAASFPGFASLGQAWAEYENIRTGDRITELMDNLKIHLEKLSTRCDNVEEVTDHIREEFPSLLEIAVDKVRKEFSQEKRELYAKVLANLSIAQYQQPYDNKIAILHSIDTLNPNDLDVLKLFTGRDEAALKDLNWRSLDLEGDDNEVLGELAGMLAKLESRGLIITARLQTGVVRVPHGLDQAMARISDTLYRILPLGKRLLSALE